MKANKHLLLTMLVFASLVGSAFVFLTAAPGPITANVQFDPDTIDLGAPGWTVKNVVVTVWFDRKYDGRDIDPKTVLIEGVLEPKGGWRHTWTERIKIDNRKSVWVFRFRVSGSALRELLWTKITHMGILGPEAVIPLEVTGVLDTRNRETFSGTDYITVFIPTTSPPPPIP